MLRPLPVWDLKIFYVLDICYMLHTAYGSGSSVSIATGYGLDGLGSNLGGGGEIFHTCPDWP